MALQPILVRLSRGQSADGLQLSYSYLDDLILAGEQHAVAHAFQFVKEKASEIGLEFNSSKCEVIPTAGLDSSIEKALFPSDIIFRSDGNFELLGGPIGTDSFCNGHTQERVEKAKEILKALGELPDPQVALTLLRHCASFGKLVFSLRVVPHRKHSDALRDFDCAVRDCIESFLCCSFSDSEWSLASLSTKMGGLGVRNTEQHSSAAFLASQSACKDLCKKLDPSYVTNPVNQWTDCHSAIADYNTKVALPDVLNINAESCPRQQVLSHNIDRNTLKSLKEGEASNKYLKAHLNLTTASGAGSWLNVIPSKALGTHVDPEIYRTMVQRWLRVPIFQSAFHCPMCDNIVDVFGDHCLTCSCGGDRTRRHNLLRNEVYYICNSAGLHPELEKPGLLQPRPNSGAVQESGSSRSSDGNRRPADVYLPRWQRGTPAALDLAVTSGLQADMVDRSSEDAAAATTSYEDLKRSHLDTENKCRDDGLTFIPIVVEADGGGWGKAAHQVWSELAKRKAIIAGERDSTMVSRILQSLGIILHKENARSILRRMPRSVGRECLEQLAASAVCTNEQQPLG